MVHIRLLLPCLTLLLLLRRLLHLLLLLWLCGALPERHGLCHQGPALASPALMPLQPLTPSAAYDMQHICSPILPFSCHIGLPGPIAIAGTGAQIQHTSGQRASTCHNILRTAISRPSTQHTRLHVIVKVDRP